MTDMLNVYDLNRRKTAILQNAYNITETKELNKIYSLSFQIPYDDEKVRYIEPFHYVRFGNDGELYRIIKTSLTEDDVSILKVDCEHVITTLIDNLLYGVTELGGKTFITTSNDPSKPDINHLATRNCIMEILNHQTTKNWVLGDCDFEYYYEYLFEQENLLNALYSIPKCFVSPYKWTFDTQSYPWKVSLKKIETNVHPEYYIRAKRNLLSSGTSQDYADICTRLYPLGYGEGVNQLTIKDVNDGKNYLEALPVALEKYGVKEKVLVDRRFENAESLKAYGQTVLDSLQTPTKSKSFNVVDLYELTNDDIDHAEVGDICKMTMDETIAYVTKTVRVLDQAGSLTIELSTKATDVVSSIADLADRVRIEQVYSQGATQLYQHSKDANATPTKGMVMSLYFPSEMRQINKVLLRMKLNKFRSYSQATESAKEVIVTNETRLENLKTTESGGGTTASGGGTSVTVSGGGVENQKTVSKSVSLNYSAEVVSSAPQETRTSSPSTDVTTGTAWDGDKSVQTEFTNNGAIEINLGNQDGELIGETYENYYANDGYHAHDYWGGTGEKSIDGGYHHHKVYVNIPSKTLSVINNDPNTSYYNGQMHRHNLTLNGLTHSHNIEHYHTVSISGTASGGSHTHTFSIPEHSHDITAHTHNLPDLSHSHKIEFQGHSHKITAGIFESGKPTGFYVYVGGEKLTNIKTVSNGKTIESDKNGLLLSKTFDGDITEWLLNESKQIPRDSWIDVEICPNDNAYIVSSVFVQGFVQSRGGGNY